MFINILLEWQKAGYVSVDVWGDIEGLINTNLLPSDDRKLEGDDQVAEFLLSHVSDHIYPSKRREFAIKHLRISEPQYEMIKEDHCYAKERNLEVYDVVRLT